MRSAGNPGGMSHAFFMERFRIEKDVETGQWVGRNPDAPFIQATLYDNPYLDRTEYEKMLDKMDYTTRMRLKFGEWGAVDDARFKSSWICTYERRGDNFILTYRDGTRQMYQLWELIIFTVIDPAASVRVGVAGAVFHKNRLPSHTVAGTFGVTPRGELLWIDCYRSQAEAPEILQAMRDICKKYRPGFVLFERNQNVALAQFMAQIGIPVRPLWQYIDKIQNSITAQVRMEQGRVFFPRDGDCEWIKKVKNEIFIWTGHPNEVDDQVDVLSNAAQMVTVLAGEDQTDPDIAGQDEGPIAIFPSVSSPI
jgi:predicted phage terminase large subunit-like protein